MSVARRLARIVGTGFGTGYFPVAPGTAGSVVGLVLYLPVSSPDRQPAFFLLLAATILVGTWAAGVCGTLFGEHDSGKIVVDEIAGMLVTLFTFPAEIKWLAAGFLAFRFFDIVKPWPIRQIDRRWKSAGGVMVDDLLAGLYANLTLHLLRKGTDLFFA